MCNLKVSRIYPHNINRWNRKRHSFLTPPIVSLSENYQNSNKITGYLFINLGFKKWRADNFGNVKSTHAFKKTSRAFLDAIMAYFSHGSISGYAVEDHLSFLSTKYIDTDEIVFCLIESKFWSLFSYFQKSVHINNAEIKKKTYINSSLFIIKSCFTYFGYFSHT